MGLNCSGIIDEIDVRAINGEGTASAFELLVPHKFQMSMSFWSGKESLPTKAIESYYQDLQASLPNGVKCEYIIGKCEYGRYSDSPSYVYVTTRIIPSPEYVKSRYMRYYSPDFENRLRTNRFKELEMMAKHVVLHGNVDKLGLYVPDDDTDRLVMSFASIGLKSLNSIIEIYTLSKVLSDLANKNENRTNNQYYAKAYWTTDRDKKHIMRVMFDTRYSPVSTDEKNLSDW